MIIGTSLTVYHRSETCATRVLPGDMPAAAAQTGMKKFTVMYSRLMTLIGCIYSPPVDAGAYDGDFACPLTYQRQQDICHFF